MSMTTIVLSNGHFRADSTEAAIAKLIEVLGDHPLDRMFEMHGDFIERGARNLRGGWLEGVENAVSFFGNFFNLAHVFSIVSNDPDHVERLSRAIAANRERPDYLRQPPPYDPDRLVIERKRFSTTQGEALMTYDGRRIEQYGDTIRPDGRGGYEGHTDQYWHKIARRDLERRHIEEFDLANDRSARNSAGQIDL
jgi:hypothetical protein